MFFAGRRFSAAIFLLIAGCTDANHGMGQPDLAGAPDMAGPTAPTSAHVPSSAGTALARTAPTSEPAWGSVRFMVPVHSPVTIFLR